ncbi:MAG: O-antigen ligase family protein [Thiofilum sp.]|uniref:O-antigen ligase family protein n=1 Tax=Thiofilum sp. TaxID=2212733 RepID=UPI0025EA6DE9|nr:O-antigen ligase family protein [Thiofilum sp.]MBK8451883.1 O-antigen ligase family protein [Thiofilum sp.]
MTLSQSWSLIGTITLLMVLPLPHTVALRLLALTLVLGMVLYQWRQLAVPKFPCLNVLLCWLLIPLILLPYAVDWRYSLSEIKVEIGYGLVGFLAFLALSQNEQWLRYWFVALGGSAACYSVIGIVQYIPIGTWNELSIVGGSASFATYIIMVLPLALPAWWLFPMHRSYVMVCVVMIVLGGLLTNQRIVLPVLITQLLIASFLLRPQQVSVRKILISIVPIIVVLSTVAFFSIQSREEVLGIAPISEDPRVLALERTLSIMSERPWTGFGFGRNAMKLAHPEIKDIMWHAHNTFLNYGIELGLGGIILLGLVWGCLARRYWHVQGRIQDPLVKSLAVAGLCVVLGVVLRNQVNDMFHRDLSLLFWCVNGALLGFLLRQFYIKN